MVLLNYNSYPHFIKYHNFLKRKKEGSKCFDLLSFIHYILICIYLSLTTTWLPANELSNCNSNPVASTYKNSLPSCGFIKSLPFVVFTSFTVILNLSNSIVSPILNTSILLLFPSFVTIGLSSETNFDLFEPDTLLY